MYPKLLVQHPTLTVHPLPNLAAHAIELVRDSSTLKHRNADGTDDRGRVSTYAYKCIYAHIVMNEQKRKQVAEACVLVLDTEFFMALCEPVRVAIIRRLVLLGRSDVAAIAEGLPQDRSVVSRHLTMLERVGIAVSEKQGRHVLYDLNGPAIVHRLEEILSVARGLADICCPSGDTAISASKVRS